MEKEFEKKNSLLNQASSSRSNVHKITDHYEFTLRGEQLTSSLAKINYYEIEPRKNTKNFKLEIKIQNCRQGCGIAGQCDTASSQTPATFKHMHSKVIF